MDSTLNSPMRPKSPHTRPKIRITVGGDPNLASLMEAVRPHAGTAVNHAIFRAAMRAGLTLFARSPESLTRALEREHHRLHLAPEELKDRTVQEFARALEMPTKRTP